MILCYQSISLILWNQTLKEAAVAERIAQWIRTPHVPGLRLGGHGAHSSVILTDCRPVGRVYNMPTVSPADRYDSSEKGPPVGRGWRPVGSEDGILVVECKWESGLYVPWCALPFLQHTTLALTWT